MKLPELRKVIDIDAEIDKTQRTLSKLHIERAQLMKRASIPEYKLSSELNDEYRAQAQYNELMKTLRKLGIKLPTWRLLKARLIRAQEIIQDLEAELPECYEKFTVILIPPTRLFSLPVDAKRRSLQAKSKKLVIGDQIDEQYCQEKHSTWKVVVVLAAEEGIHRGQPMRILTDQTYRIAGYDMRGLGAREYAALTLFVSSPIDVQTNTMLIKGYTANAPVLVARYDDRHYVFEADETGVSGLFGDDRYRPAIEVK